MSKEIDQDDLRTLGVAWILARTRELGRNEDEFEEQVESFFLVSFLVFGR